MWAFIRVYRSLARYLFALLLLRSLAGCSLAKESVEPHAQLMASGTLTARQVRVASELGGRLVELPYRQGDEVQVGDVLAVLDDTVVLAELAQAQAALDAARSNLALVLAGALPAEVEAAEAQLALSRAERDAAYVAWQDALKLIDAPNELDGLISEAQSSVRLAELGVQAAEIVIEQEIADRDIRQPGTPDYQYHEHQVAIAQAALLSAQSDLQIASVYLGQLYTIREQPIALEAQARLAKGEYQVTAAQIPVAQAQLTDARRRVTVEEIAEAQALIEQARALVGLLQVKQEMLTLASPLDGVVIERTARVGETVAQGASLLTVADLSELTLTVYVPVTRLGEVALGQTVGVQVDGLPDRDLSGRLTRIADQAEFTPRNVATKQERVNTVYAVEIRVANPTGELKPGMAADARWGRGEE